MENVASQDPGTQGESFQNVIDNGGEEYLKLGTRVTFVSAPRYFGDGYDVPIVALSIDGKELLSFEEGHKNLMDSYRYVFEEEDAR